MPNSVLKSDLSGRSPALVAAAVSWHLHPLRADLLNLRAAPEFGVLAFTNALSSTVLNDLEPMSPLRVPQDPFLVEQKTRYDIERNLDFEVYKRYASFIVVFPKEESTELIRSRYGLDSLEFVNFPLDETIRESQKHYDAFYELKRKAGTGRQAERFMKGIVDDLVTPKFLELSQQMRSLFDRQTDEIRAQTKEIPEISRKLDLLLAKPKP